MSRATYSRLADPKIRAALDLVASARGVTVAALTSKSRQQYLAAARFIAYGVLREMGLSTPEIGAVLNRDHTTVLHGLQQLEPDGLLCTVQAVVSRLNERGAA